MIVLFALPRLPSRLSLNVFFSRSYFLVEVGSLPFAIGLLDHRAQRISFVSSRHHQALIESDQELEQYLACFLSVERETARHFPSTRAQGPRRI